MVNDFCEVPGRCVKLSLMLAVGCVSVNGLKGQLTLNFFDLCA